MRVHTFMQGLKFATMIAAFGGRFDVDREVNIRKSSCVEHRLSTCIVDSFSSGKISELDHFMDQISYIEIYYNTHTSKAENLPFVIPTKSSTREWRSHYRRFKANLENYSHYLNDYDEQFLNQIPNIIQIIAPRYPLSP